MKSEQEIRREIKDVEVEVNPDVGKDKTEFNAGYLCALNWVVGK